MNDRKYYKDSYTTTFSASVTDHLVLDGKPALILDQTYFYPTSGGQPHDVGQINEIPVLDVLVRLEDGAIVHILEKAVESDRISGTIDWSRRFDHMQHHTGQHILSQAFIRIAGAQTVGFHLSDSSVTIDLDKKELTEAEIDAAEEMTNAIIWQNRPIKILEVTHEEALALPLRKIPPTNNEFLRLIDITDFDLTACGGTHVAYTAEIGLLKIVKQERRGEKQRIEFCCGSRALSDYRLKHQVTTQLSAQLTTGAANLVPAIERLQEDLKQSVRQLKKQQDILDNLEVQQLLANSRHYGDLILITQVFAEGDQGQIRALGKKLVQNKDTVALLGLAGERSQLLFCKAEDVPGSMKAILPAGLQELGSQSGGGNDNFAQGVGSTAGVEQVQKAVHAAESLFLQNLGLIG